MTPPPLRREVEPPRQRTTPWMPLLALGATSMLTIAMAIAVATPPHARDTWTSTDQGVRRDAADAHTRHPRGVLPSAAIEAVNEQTGGFAACIREWSERTGENVATVTVAFLVTSSGAIDDIGISGIDDRVVPDCTAARIRKIAWPATGRELHIRVDVNYVEGQTRVLTSLLE